MAIPQSTIERFWAKVDFNGPIPAHCPELGPCHVWIAGKFSNGYGCFGPTHGKSVLAHRFVWELSNPQLKPGEYVCHKCDNNACVRLLHLFLGDAQKNMADRDAKGRQASGNRSGAFTHPERICRGVKHGRSKLTEAEIFQIRDLLTNTPLQQRDIAALYGVSQNQISYIKLGKQWRHILPS